MTKYYKRYYKNSGYKVQYGKQENILTFNCWKIESINEENLSKSIFEDEDSIAGYVSRDGSMQLVRTSDNKDFNEERSLSLFNSIYEHYSTLDFN